MLFKVSFLSPEARATCPSQEINDGRWFLGGQKRNSRTTRPRKAGRYLPYLRFLESHLGLLSESWSIAQDIAAAVKMFFYYLGRMDRFGTCPRGQALRDCIDSNEPQQDLREKTETNTVRTLWSRLSPAGRGVYPFLMRARRRRSW